MNPEHTLYVRKCVSDFETRNSPDKNKKLGDYLVNIGQYHLDSRGYKKMATGAVVLAPAGQALAATLVSACRHLLDGEVTEIHLLDALKEYTKKYYREAADDIADLCKEAKKYI